MGKFFLYISYLFSWMPSPLNILCIGFVAIMMVLFFLKIIKLVWDVLPIA